QARRESRAAQRAIATRFFLAEFAPLHPGAKFVSYASGRVRREERPPDARDLATPATQKGPSMESFFLPQNWPLVVVSLGMIACAVIDWWKFKVPNYLTFPLILSGWLLGFVHNVFSWCDFDP